MSVEIGELAQRQRRRFDDEIVERHLGVIRGLGVDLLAQRRGAGPYRLLM